MSDIKKVLICGLGAIGSIYAVKIAEKCPSDLFVLVDAERFERYNEKPLIFNRREYYFNYIIPNSPKFEADLIIIATKNKGLDEAIKNIQNFVGENTIILSLLNGIKSEEQIASVYGEDKVLDSYYIGHTSSRNDREVFHDGVGEIVFGEKNNEILSEKVKKIKEFFEKIGIEYEIPIDMDYAKWWKFLVNVGYNQASALLSADYGVFQSSVKVNDIAVKLMEETVSVAKASGVNNTEKMIPEVLETIKTMLPQTRTSMLQDIDAKRETEVDIFSGHVRELGQFYNIITPYNDVVFSLIKAIDEKNLL